MGSYRIQRVADEIKRIVAEIFIREFTSEEIGLVTVTKVTCTSDLREAKIYLSIYHKDREFVNVALEKIRAQTAFIRGLLGHRIALKFVPRIAFYYDDSQEYAENIERLFQKIHEQEGENPTGTT